MVPHAGWNFDWKPPTDVFIDSQPISMLIGKRSALRRNEMDELSLVDTFNLLVATIPSKSITWNWFINVWFCRYRRRFRGIARQPPRPHGGPGALPDRMWMSIFHPLGRTPVGPIGGLTRETIRFYLNTCLNTSHGATPKTEYRGGDDDSFFIPPSV